MMMSRNAKNGLKMEVWTNQVGCQFYTGNHLHVKKSSAKSYEIHNGLAIEPHNYPDSVNQVSGRTRSLFLIFSTSIKISYLFFYSHRFQVAFSIPMKNTVTRQCWSFSSIIKRSQILRPADSAKRHAAISWINKQKKQSNHKFDFFALNYVIFCFYRFSFSATLFIVLVYFYFI